MKDKNIEFTFDDFKEYAKELADIKAIYDDLINNGKIQEMLKVRQENKQLKEIIKENTILVKDEYGDYQERNINPLGMKKKYEKQVNNWNKLKEYIKEEGFEIKTKEYGSLDVISKDVIIEKMQELEQGSENGG